VFNYAHLDRVPPPGVLIASKAMSVDARAEPRYGERVPYIVVAGTPGARIRDLVASPADFLNTKSVVFYVIAVLMADRNSLRLHSNYYITRQIIPSLNRILCVLGVGKQLQRGFWALTNLRCKALVYRNAEIYAPEYAPIGKKQR